MLFRGPNKYKPLTHKLGGLNLKVIEVLDRLSFFSPINVDKNSSDIFSKRSKIFSDEVLSNFSFVKLFDGDAMWIFR